MYGFPLAAIPVSGGFFTTTSGKDVKKSNRMIIILYPGMLVLAASLIILGSD
jgi:hypothetical protein